MKVNARTDKFQHLEVFDKPALFTNGRIARDTVPQGWYCYDIRGSDDDPGELCYMEENVVVNHAGSVLMPEKLAMPKSGRLDVRDELGFLDEGDMTLREFCEAHQIPYPAENMKFHIRPARPEEAGLFYAQHPEENKRLGAVGCVRMDFGRSGNEFWHTWWPRGPEELNSPAFKAELQQIVGKLREDVLKSRFANMIKARIRPYFAPLGLQLREVTPQHIEDFYQSILADDCTTNTVIHYHAIIRKALQTAVKKDILLKNPADKVDRPKKNVFHGSFYSEEEMLTLFDAVSGDPLELCVKIAAYYGLRRSEVLGLRWSAIDMEHKTISISHKVIEAEVDGKFVPMGEDVLKTKSSFRTLPLIPAVGIILLEEKEKQEMYRRLFKKSYCRDYLDYICVDQCGKLLRPNYVTEHFSWLIEKYGLRKVRFHDLRHTCASLLLSNGISMKQIQIWLGHSTFSTTADIYAHLDYSAQEASANAMNGMFNRPEKEEQLA